MGYSLTSNNTRVFVRQSAIAAILQSLITPGARILHIHDLYSGTLTYFSRLAEILDLTLIPFTNISELPHLLDPTPALIWLETITNPTLKVPSLSALHSLLPSCDIPIILDNTFASPVLGNFPLSRGASIVVHSVSKYINGHTDVCMGVACTNDTDMHTHLRFQQIHAGGCPSPFDCWLALRGLRTLPIRMKAIERNAIALAKLLEKHDLVEKVAYPGLESDPEFQVANKELLGFGGVIGFWIKGGSKTCRAFLESVKIMTCAVSLGGVETLVECPAIMTHVDLSEEERMEKGIDEGFVRLAVGIEGENDLINDLKQALENARAVL